MVSRLPILRAQRAAQHVGLREWSWSRARSSYCCEFLPPPPTGWLLSVGISLCDVQSQGCLPSFERSEDQENLLRTIRIYSNSPGGTASSRHTVSTCLLLCNFVSPPHRPCPPEPLALLALRATSLGLPSLLSLQSIRPSVQRALHRPTGPSVPGTDLGRLPPPPVPPVVCGVLPGRARPRGPPLPPGIQGLRSPWTCFLCLCSCFLGPRCDLPRAEALLSKGGRGWL